MPIRIQPKEIPIQADDPFAHDLLDRRESVEVFTRLISTVDGPCVVALDAAWGAGKTTFLKMWAQYLRNEGFPVVEFNAWETDASGDPFLAVSTEITEGLKRWGADPVRYKIRQTELLAKQLLQRAAPGALRLAASLVPVVGVELGHFASSWAEDALSAYTRTQQTVRQYRDSLQAMADAHWEASDHKPIVVFIDELDRCRPSYAVELLETAKHIFSVDHVVYVLAVNRSELAHSVKALYGDGFGANAYLRRFFDIDFRLPSPGREQFIQDLLASASIPGLFDQVQNHSIRSLYQESVHALMGFFSQSVFTLRDVGQAVHRFGLVMSSLSASELALIRTLTALLIIQTLDSTLYRRLANHDNTLTDERAVEAFFARMDRVDLRYSPLGRFVEWVIIASMVGAADIERWDGEVPEHLPRYGQLRSEFADSPRPSADASVENRSDYQLFDLIRASVDPFAARPEALNFDIAVRRLELLST